MTRVAFLCPTEVTMNLSERVLANFKTHPIVTP